MRVEQFMRWIVNLNLSYHLGFAIFTALTMLIMGVVLSSLIEILFVVVRVGSRRSRLTETDIQDK